MADREYVFNAVDNSVSVSTSWGIFYAPGSSGSSTTSTSITTGIVSTYFEISGIVINEGESIKKVVLTSTKSSYGTIDDNASFNLNGSNYSPMKKMDASGIINGTNYELTFSLRASGKAGQAGDYTAPNFYTMTSTVSDMVLTVTVGAGNAFDGKVSSLNEGDKIIIGENSANASYTLVHHEYNPGKALIFRDSSYGTSAYRSSASYNGYNGSKLDKYLTETFFTALPETTTQFLQTIDYPIKETAYNSSSAITINRTAATISAIETGLGGTTGYGSVLNYTDTVGIGTYYWTREPVSGMDGYAKCINSSNALANQSLRSSYGVRPTLGILEEQLVRYSEADGGYLFCDKCTAPDTLYINGSETDVSGLNREVNLTLSWTAGTAGYNAPISGYAVWYSTAADGTYELYGTTTDTSMTIIGPTKSSQTYYFKVQTLGPEDADYCNSELSSTYRAAATKLGNVSYYDGTRWLLAAMKYYNGSAWVDIKRAKSYDGNTWK